MTFPPNAAHDENPESEQPTEQLPATTRQKASAARGWVVFAACLIVFSFAAWLAWGALVSHDNPLIRHATGKTSASVTIAVGTVPDSLNVHDAANTTAAQYLVGNVYETITGRNESNNATAGLAKSWDESDDGLTFTFHLNTGMHFANGDALDASDVVWSLQQTVSNNYAGASELSKLASVSNTDDTTVVMTLSAPDQTLPWKLSGVAGIVWDEQDPGDDTTPGAGSGPYALGALDAGTSLTLNRNDDYWKASHAEVPASVKLTAYSDAAQATTDLQKGAIDAVLPLNGFHTSAVDGMDGIRAITMQSTQKTAIAFHSGGTTFFADPDVRASARTALDENAIINAAGVDGTRLNGPIAPLDPGYEDLEDTWGYDPQAAMANYRFTGRYRLYFVYRQSDEALANAIINAFTAASWYVTGVELDDASYEDRVINQQDYDMTIVHFDGSRDLGSIEDPSSFVGYTNATTDSLWSQVQAATTDTDYSNAAAALARQINNDCAYDWLYVATPSAAARTSLTGMPTLYSPDRLDLTALHVE
ncbi:MAG: ABC transporter substrate-binding protein [Bifidobacteriaceae bacterium]|nr:ABC transporter substrate-binding protein [Bifidobacteriaceae bacterium]